MSAASAFSVRLSHIKSNHRHRIPQRGTTCLFLAISHHDSLGTALNGLGWLWSAHASHRLGAGSPFPFHPPCSLYLPSHVPFESSPASRGRVKVANRRWGSIQIVEIAYITARGPIIDYMSAVDTDTDTNTDTWYIFIHPLSISISIFILPPSLHVDDLMDDHPFLSVRRTELGMQTELGSHLVELN